MFDRLKPRPKPDLTEVVTNAIRAEYPGSSPTPRWIIAFETDTADEWVTGYFLPAGNTTSPVMALGILDSVHHDIKKDGERA